MKQRNLFLVTCLLLMGGVQSAMAQRVVVNLTDNQSLKFDVSQVESITFEDDDWVDLALPSGTLWAKCNVGASSPEEYGDYFAWGETEPKDNYCWATYQHSNGSSSTITKYNSTDNKMELLPEDDAAANSGGEWQMPTMEQGEELFNTSYTNTKWTQVNGVNGLKVTSLSNGKSIFLPATGFRKDTDIISVGNNGSYWTTTRASYAMHAYEIHVSSGGFTKYMADRSWGNTIRPVKAPVVKGHEYVEIAGLKWATMNVGATTVAGSYETCFGDYFAWGETEPRYASMHFTSAEEATFVWKKGYASGYDEGNYPTYVAWELDAAHDAATANWGGSWRTPTKEDFEALAVACSGSSANEQKPDTLSGKVTSGGIYWLRETQTYEPEYTGVAGLLFVSKSDITKRVFFPYADCILNTWFMGGMAYGYYWTSSLDTQDPTKAYFLTGYYGFSVSPSVSGGRCYGFSVRPVSE